MAKDIVLYAYTFPSRAERVIWALEELELEYELKRLDPFKGETFTEEFRSLNPDSKIPVLTHKGHVFTESLAILEYLHSLKPDRQLIPDDNETQQKLRHSIYYTATEVEPYLWICDQANRLKSLYPWPDGTTDTALERINKNIQTVFNKVIDNDFVCGNTFTFADIYIWHVLAWSRGYNLEMPEQVHTYLKKLSERDRFPESMKSNPNKTS